MNENAFETDLVLQRLFTPKANQDRCTIHRIQGKLGLIVEAYGNFSKVYVSVED